MKTGVMYNLAPQYRSDGAFVYFKGVNVLPAELSKDVIFFLEK